MKIKRVDKPVKVRVLRTAPGETDYTSTIIVSFINEETKEGYIGSFDRFLAPRSKGRKWLKAILGRDVYQDGIGVVDMTLAQEMVGKPCRIVLYSTGRVKDVLPPEEET